VISRPTVNAGAWSATPFHAATDLVPLLGPQSPDAVADRAEAASTAPLLAAFSAALAALPQPEAPSRPIKLAPPPPRGYRAPHRLPRLTKALWGVRALWPPPKRDELAPLRVRPARMRHGSRRLRRARVERLRRSRSPGRPDDEADSDLAAAHGAYPVVRVAPEPGPTLLASEVAALLARVGGPEFAAEVLRRAVREFAPAEAEERLGGAPASVQALFSGCAS
jgi:hypothetical protein